MTTMRIDEVAESLRCSTRTVRRLIQSGDLVSVRIRGMLRVTSDSVRDLIARKTEVAQ